MSPRGLSRFLSLVTGRRSVLLGIVCLGLAPWTSLAAAERTPEFIVIVHPDNPQNAATREFLADAFLKKTTRWSHDETIRPVDLRPSSATRRYFSDRVLKRSVAAVRSYWQQRIFSGRGVPPPELDDERSAVHYVLKYPGAVAYVAGDTKLEGAKVLAIH